MRKEGSLKGKKRIISKKDDNSVLCEMTSNRKTKNICRKKNIIQMSHKSPELKVLKRYNL